MLGAAGRPVTITIQYVGNAVRKSIHASGTFRQLPIAEIRPEIP